LFALASEIIALISETCAGGAEPSDTSVVCVPTEAGTSLLAAPGGWRLKVCVLPWGRSEPEKLSMKATRLATSWSLVTLKTGSATKRSMLSTPPSWR